MLKKIFKLQKKFNSLVIDHIYYKGFFDDLCNQNSKYEIIKLLCKYIAICYNVHEDQIELALFTKNLINILHI